MNCKSTQKKNQDNVRKFDANIFAQQEMLRKAEASRKNFSHLHGANWRLKGSSERMRNFLSSVMTCL